MTPVTIAVVGAGTMGAQHARVIAETGRARLGVVVDSDATRADEVAARFDTIASVDLEAALRCDAVVLASPTEAHLAAALAVLDAGLPLLVEKPLASSLADAEAVVDRARFADIPLMCGLVERWNPAFQTALKLLDEAPLHVVSTRHSPRSPRIVTDVVHDLLIHDLDLALALCGEPAVVRGVGWRCPDGMLEIVDAVLGFASGAVATCSGDRWNQRKVRSLSVSSETRLIELDLLRQDVTVYRHVRHELSPGGGYRAETVVDIPFVRHSGEPLAIQLDHFLDLIEGTADATVERRSLLPPHALAAAVLDAVGSP